MSSITNLHPNQASIFFAVICYRPTNKLSNRIMRHLNVFLVVTTLVLIMSMQQYEACRILYKEEKWMAKHSVLQSLQKRVPPMGPNGCTFIPGRGGPPCTTQRNFAGHAMPPPPPRVYADDH
ncbi:hypothetical protein Dsin_024905 [Dipteronia sinensis]|uniref:Uncharacterized protein n=1 Tax=Dipteronia sinensis TaxID=43782 RepID=A0AAD9ZUL7_9ROSI|nr:hypothetical protein Dsin_024905 [Dipteronia sinensis]